MHPALTAAVVLLCAAFPAAAQSRQQMLVDEKSASVVEVTSVFSFVPPTGYAPVRVKAINNTAGDFTVTLNAVSEANNPAGNDHQLESTFTLSAPAGKTTEREFTVPLCTTTSANGYATPQLRVQLQAGGHSESFGFPGGGTRGLPFTAFSDALAEKTIGDINKAAASSSSGSSFGRETFACLYTPAMLSADWRGFSGLDVLAITAEEWTALPAGTRSAVLQWVKLGGSLNVYVKAGGQSLTQIGIPAQGPLTAGPDFGGHAFALGNGRVCELRWNGAALEGKVAVNYKVSPLEDSRLEVRRLEYAHSVSDREQESRGSGMKPSPLVSALGEKSFAAWQVGIILFIFGVVVGPVNLFYLAGKGRRHRLFITTPIISLAAAALLLLVIFFQDGTGGQGHRASLVYLDSADNTAFIHQLQVSRCGVLFGGTFDLAEPAVVNLAIMPESRWTRLKTRDDSLFSYRSSGGSEAQRYSVQDKSYGGDWFQSRSEQAQIIDAVQSTRGRIELKSDSTPPVITSTISAPLERVCYTDAAGKHWASPGAVATGAEVTLSEISGDDFSAWRRAATGSLHKELRDTLNDHRAPGFFYASSADAKAGMVETLGSIEWESSRVFLYGPLK